MNKPSLRFPEFTNEWEPNNLGNLLEFKNGINANKEQYGRGFKFINVLDILNNDYITHDLIVGCVDIDQETANKYQVKFGDILFQRSSETREEVGTANVYLDKEKTATFGGFVIRGAKIKEYDPVFLNVLLKTDFVREQIISKSGGSTRYNVGQEILSSIILYMPSLQEQGKIASLFSLLDIKISQLKRKKYLIEEYKKGLILNVFSQDLRFTDKEGKKFAEWEKMQLSDILFEHLEKNNENKIKEVFSVAKHKGVINQIDHLGRSFSAKEILNYKIVYPGDVIYTKSPTSEFLFGIIKQNLTKRVGVVSPLYGVFRPKTKALGFLLHNYFLSWINTYNYLNPLVKRGAKNTMNIKNSDFLNGAEISLPVDEEEQIKIAAIFEAIDTKINQTQEQIELNENYKLGLLQKMFY